MYCYRNGTGSTEEMLVYTYFLACGCITVILNSIVLYIAVKHVNFHKKPNQILVMSMTLADLCFGLCFMLSRPFLLCAPTWLCGPYYVLLWSCQIGSTTFLLLLNVDKFIRIQFPLNYRNIVTSKRVIAASFILWSLIAAVSGSSFYGPFMDREASENCVSVRFSTPLYYALMTLFGYATPTVCSLAISVCIFVLAHRASKSVIRRASRAGRNGAHATKLMMKRIVFVFSSTIWTSATFLPYRIAYLMYSVCATRQYSAPEIFNDTSTQKPEYGSNVDLCAGNTIKIMIDIFFYTMMLGSLGNPLVTIVTQNTYKNRVVHFWIVMASRLCRLPDMCYPSSPRTKASVNDDYYDLDELSSPGTQFTSLTLNSLRQLHRFQRQANTKSNSTKELLDKPKRAISLNTEKNTRYFVRQSAIAETPSPRVTPLLEQIRGDRLESMGNGSSCGPSPTYRKPTILRTNTDTHDDVMVNANRRHISLDNTRL